MDGARRMIDLNRSMNNNDDVHHHHHGNNHNNSGPNDYDVPLGGIPVAGLDCTGHTFMSLLLQPSPLRSTPDTHLNLRHGQNSSGFEIGLHEHQVVTWELNYMDGSFESNPYNLGHGSPRNFTNLPNEIPYANSIEPHYNGPVTMMEDLVPYSSLQLAPFDCVDYGHPPNLHYSATSGAAGFEQHGSIPPAVEEIMFGGRIIEATRVELSPVRPSSFVSAPETAVSALPVIPGPSAAYYGQEAVFYHPQGVAPTQNASGHPNFPWADLGHMAAAQHHVRPASPTPSWPINERDSENYLDFPQWRIQLDVAMESFEAGQPSEADDVEEENSAGDSMYVELQDWSYEALIALQELVGDVSTGLSEGEISSVLRRERFGQTSFDADAPCCTICQEEYKEEQEVGMLKCSHQFHFDCIKKWLSRKNTCPLCRETA